MKNVLSWAKTFLPSVLIFIVVFIGELLGGKHILDGIYIWIPLVYLHQGVLCTDSLLKASIGFTLSSAVFLTFINLWFKMGSCIDLALIYLALGTLAYGAKILILKAIKKKNQKA